MKLSKYFIVISSIFINQAYAAAQVVECTKDQKESFRQEILNTSQDVHGDLARHMEETLIAKGYAVESTVLQKDCSDTSSEEIQFFHISYSYKRPVQSSRPPFITLEEVVSVQLTGSYLLNTAGSYNFIRVRTFRSHETIQPPNAGHGSSSTAN